MVYHEDQDPMVTLNQLMELNLENTNLNQPDMGKSATLVALNHAKH